MKFVNFLKSRAIFNIFSCLHISRARISKRKRCVNMEFSTYYFHMETKILADFQISISVPLSQITFSCNSCVTWLMTSNFCTCFFIYLFLLWDTLKAFYAFQNKQKSVSGNIFRYIKVYIFWKCIQYTTDWVKTQITFGENKRYKKCPYFSFASSNSSQFYFEFAILIWAEAQGSSLKNYLWDFPFLIPFPFY